MSNSVVLTSAAVPKQKSCDFDDGPLLGLVCQTPHANFLKQPA